MRKRISYAITVCNEAEQLNRLLALLQAYLKEGDEVVVQADSEHVTDVVKQVLANHATIVSKQVYYPLQMDFARFKNHLNEQCTGDFIFQLDADELPQTWLLEHLQDILSRHPWIELFKVPRINLFDQTLTPASIGASDGRVAWPDYQGRIYKNRPGRIRWHRPLHERIRGHLLYWHLPKDDRYALIHCKSLHQDTKKWNQWKQAYAKN